VTIAFTKVKHPFIHKPGYLTRITKVLHVICTSG
jgi:hypothetical protein